jgi:polysaccharide pyruvyl transferase CsaB
MEPDSLREALAARIFDQGVHYRILFVRGAEKKGGDRAASMCRALRNLGHHVLDLDLERHSGLIDMVRPLADATTATTVGAAAAFLKARDFDHVCAKVSPHIIVLCANDLTLSAEHAERLKQQGMVLVGVAVVETDGIACARPPHADVFDFYALCNRESHDRIHGVGLTNTVHVPWAFDRDAIVYPLGSDRYRKTTAKAFQRIVAGHLVEHRCMALLEIIFNCSPDTTPWLGDARIKSIRQTLSRSLPRCKQVIVSGFYGATNVGDELILRAIASALHASDPALQVKVAAENPVAVERDHGLQAFSGKNQNEALHQVRTACAIVVGGGGLWHDYSFARSGGLTGIFQEPQLSMASYAVLPILGRFFNIPCHVVGMGVGPITTPDAFRMLRFVAELAETIHVRDEPSLALLATAGVSQDKAIMAPDVVYALSLPKVEPASNLRQLKADGYTIVGMNLRPWAPCDEANLLARVMQALQVLGPAIKLAIVTLPMQNTDNTTLAHFVAKLPEHVQHVALKAPLVLDDLLTTLIACDVVIAMRLHTCLLAHRLRKPVLGLAYDPKVDSHFEQVGRSAFSVSLDAPASDIAKVIRICLGEEGQLPSETDRTLHALEDSARAALTLATQRLAGLSCAEAVFRAPEELPSIRAELIQLRALHKT